jgi:hypothetical protein
MKDLITSAFPRSGSTYLNQALQLLYYPTEEVNRNRHTTIAIEKSEKIIVSFRNPKDSIASWHKYPSNGLLEADIKYYVRFYSYVLDNLNKVVLMDFDLFTQDLEYTKSKVLDNFDISTDQVVTDAQVKEAMLANGKEINLPRNNKDQIDKIKAELSKIPEFQDCLSIYNSLLNLA